MLQPTYDLPSLPPEIDLETIPILKALAEAHRVLAEVKGRAVSIPNQGILIGTLILQEAKESSAIENIVTTQDELFQAEIFPDVYRTSAAKEVAHYRDTLYLGYNNMRDKGGLITNNTLIDMFRVLKSKSGGFRETPGTALHNDATGERVYVPPQSKADIVKSMTALESYINTQVEPQLDPLTRMALIHHQFESIHPFPDGNGRIGRILNVLYLTQTGLLDIPVLYLSRHINRTKDEYYRLLQAVREDNVWEEWVLYMLRAVTSTSHITLELIEGIREQMLTMKRRMREETPKRYSQDLLNNLFRHPYTRIEFVQRDLHVTRQTAARILDELAKHGFVLKMQAGRHNYYVNAPLIQLFSTVGES